MISLISQFLALATIAGNILAVVLIGIWLHARKMECAPSGYVRRNAILFAFLVALISTLGSLFYSEIAGYAPCKLCWFQRIFMYPQSILFAIALWRRERVLAPYAMALSAIGGLIALYHYLLQLNVVSGVPCSAVGYSVSCSKIFVLQYGYVTIPLMAATGFALILLLMLFSSPNDSKRS